MTDRSTRRKTLHEAAHKVDLEGRGDGDGDDDVRSSKRPFQKPSLNMAAHKLGYWSPDDDDEGEIMPLRRSLGPWSLPTINMALLT